MLNLLLTLPLLLADLPCAAQEPATPPDAPPAPTEQEPITEEQILEAIEKVRSTYDKADESVRVGVEATVPDAQSRGSALRPAERALNELVADMEALLELLPKDS